MLDKLKEKELSEFKKYMKAIEEIINNRHDLGMRFAIFSCSNKKIREDVKSELKNKGLKVLSMGINPIFIIKW